MNEFKYWSKDRNLHRWYFDDGSYIEARRRNSFHIFKIADHPLTRLKENQAHIEFHKCDNAPLMKSIYNITGIDCAKT